MATSDLRRICEFVDALNKLPNIGGGVVIENARLSFAGEYERYDCGHWLLRDDTVRADIEWLPDLDGPGGMHRDGGYVVTQVEG